MNLLTFFSAWRILTRRAAQALQELFMVKDFVSVFITAVLVLILATAAFQTVTNWSTLAPLAN